ncbi:MAG TPA: hypothetical protein VF057_14305 [Thermoanaerobaculia bacterium]
MRKTTSLAVLFLSLVVSLPAVAAQRSRITNRGYAVLNGKVVDATGGAGVFQVEVEGGNFFARTDNSGRFTLELPIGTAITFTMKRTGYETLTEKITLSGRTDREFRLTARPTARIVTTSGVNYHVDADSVEFGWAVPFSGYRRDRSAQMCRPGGGEFKLDRDDVRRVEGPATSVTDAACCANNPLTGAVFEMKNGERQTAYFLESCKSAVMEVIARDHATYNLVFVPLRELQEVVMP